jgi:hypothetical protein
MIPLQQIHQIEITSRCNLRCVYCVHPTMAREKKDMDRETFSRALHWALHFQNAGTQGSINLAGIGESTMHESFIEYLAMTRSVLGPAQDIVLATNGVVIARNPSLAEQMAPYRPKVYVSLHRPEKAGIAVELLSKAGILAGVSADSSISATDWAGQVKWHVSARKGSPCPWVRGGWGIVLSDGRITRCAFDGTGIGVIGHVNDDLSKMQTSPYSLCKSCHQDVGLPIPEGAAA